MIDNKDYFKNMCLQIISDFKCAKNEEEQWKCRKELNKLLLTATEIYGFDFADELENVIHSNTL